MKAMAYLMVFCWSLMIVPSFAHHAAEGIIDDEIYARVESMVADTPHAELDFDDSQPGMVEIIITTQMVRSLESMLEDGLLSTIAILDGEVFIEIEFDEKGGATMTVTQMIAEE